MRIAVQMDPIEDFIIQGDTTFALMLAAQDRGYEVSYYLPDSLALTEEGLTAFVYPVYVRDEVGNHADIGEGKRVSLKDYDVILLRQDPPFDMHYITSTHLLEHVHPSTLVVNDPVHVRNAPEKLLITKFKNLLPPTLITKDLEMVKSFREQYKDIIIKPLYGNGGAGVFRLKEGDNNLYSLHEIFTQMWREPFMVQQYRPEVREGDKRILLIDGEPVGAINRRPQADEVRSNMHVGGTAEAVDITLRELEMCSQIGPYLKEHGLTLVGIDVIGDFMTEINVTSPTGVREVKKFGGADVASLFWDAVSARLK